MTKDAGRGEGDPLADVLDWWNDGAGKEPPYRNIGKVLKEVERLRDVEERFGRLQKRFYDTCGMVRQEVDAMEDTADEMEGLERVNEARVTRLHARDLRRAVDPSDD